MLQCHAYVQFWLLKLLSYIEATIFTIIQIWKTQRILCKKALYFNSSNLFLQRDRKEPKFYIDDFIGDADDEIEGRQSFDLEEKLATSRYDDKRFVKELKGTGVTNLCLLIHSICIFTFTPFQNHNSKVYSYYLLCFKIITFGLGSSRTQWKY